MRRGRSARLLGLAAAVLIACIATPVVAGPVPPAAAADQCTPAAGSALTVPTWPYQHLNYARLATITTAQKIKVAVVDSGVQDGAPGQQGPFNPRITPPSITYGPAYNVLTRTTNVSDCTGHGTSIAGIIAAAPDPVHDRGFAGVAPGVTMIYPIKFSQDGTSTPAAMAAGIERAVQDRVDIINLSAVVAYPDPRVLQAVRDADRAGIIIVCARGNIDLSSNPMQRHQTEYPAAWSLQLPNIITVAGIEKDGSASSNSDYGPDVDISAPGGDQPLLAEKGGYWHDSGSSFATAYVTGTVALVKATHRGLDPAQIRTRLELTADRSAAGSFDPHFGYGIVNPFNAVTSVIADSTAPPPAPATVQPHLPPITPPVAADRSAQHIALGAAGGLFGLAGVAIVIAAVLRRTGSPRRGAAGG